MRSDELPTVLAAVDLGSNSFHMIVARCVRGQPCVIDRRRETVRLAAGVAETRRIDAEAAARAIACLERFGRRLRELEAEHVRVVGTNALRLARNEHAFLVRASAVLGHPIEIVSGLEEARLIYSGVAHSLPDAPRRRLVVDIGGGSTEIIVGEDLRPLHLDSLQIGCVSLSEQFFADGTLSRQAFGRARQAARLELGPSRDACRRLGWQHALGSSGTVHAIADAIRQLDPSAASITPAGLELLLDYLVGAGHARELRLSAVTEDRRPIFPAGVAILSEVVDTLGVSALHVAEGALRDGVLHDLIGRLARADAREHTIRAMQERYRVDAEHAERVAATAVEFLARTRTAWALEQPLAELALRWAAQLHEIGRAISGSDHHRHGGELIAQADMPGFSVQEQRLLAFLVAGQRDELASASLELLAPPWNRQALCLLVLLRLAVLLSGRGGSGPAVGLRPGASSLELGLPVLGPEELPLLAELIRESALLEKQGFRLRIRTPEGGRAP